MAADQTLPLRQINHQVCVYVQLKVERYVSIISLSLLIYNAYISRNFSAGATVLCSLPVYDAQLAKESLGIFFLFLILGECRDTGKYCSYHVPRGDCERMDIVRRKCRKSCGLCSEGNIRRTMEETSVLDTNYVLHEHHALIKLCFSSSLPHEKSLINTPFSLSLFRNSTTEH